MDTLTLTTRYPLHDEFHVQEVVDKIVRPLIDAACERLDVTFTLNHIRHPYTSESGLELVITRKPTPMKVARIDIQA